MKQTLEYAIRNKLLVQLTYDPGLRVIEPHALGYGSEGQILLRAYQVSGSSASHEHVEWKLFRIDRAVSATTSGASFSVPRKGYKRGDQAMSLGIIIEL